VVGFRQVYSYQVGQDGLVGARGEERGREECRGEETFDDSEEGPVGLL